MEIKILNVWKSQPATLDKDLKLAYFNEYESSKVYSIGDYAIFKQSPISYLYTYKNIGINQLAGLNKEHLNSLYLDKRPQNNPDLFLFDRAKDNLQRGLDLLKTDV